MAARKFHYDKPNRRWLLFFRPKTPRDRSTSTASVPRVELGATKCDLAEWSIRFDRTASQIVTKRSLRLSRVPRLAKRLVAATALPSPRVRCGSVP